MTEPTKQRVLTDRNGKKWICTIDASLYGPDATGKTDCTDALQRAIDDCKRAGGGSVYLPAGRYALYKPLRIRTSVMLHGAGEEGSPEEKTVLCCYYGRGDTDGMQIAMEACTGLIGAAIYHPEQDVEAPVPYPPAVRQCGSNSITVERVLFANPWIGIQCGPDANELHFIKNVKISPLFQGIFMDMTTDIGRMQHLSISPVWYQRFLGEEPESCRLREDGASGEPVPVEEGGGSAAAGENGDDEFWPARKASACARFMLARATGIYMARSDWEYGYDISVEGCETGLLVTSEQDIGPNAQFYNLHIKDCEIGVRLHCGNPYGIAVTDGSIRSGARKRKAAIQCDDTFKAVLQCYGLSIEGEYEHLVLQEGDGQLSFLECDFDGKGRESDVKQAAGGLALLNTSFREGGVSVEQCRGAGGTQIVGCGELEIRSAGESKKNLLYKKEPLPVTHKRSGGHVPYPYSLEPESSSLYLVTEYGAAGDGEKDDTEAFEAALGAAGGIGGYVYVPGGKYKLTRPLQVPAGVELRGTAEVPCHTMGGGSVLMICCGEGEEEGTPFFTLEGNCGLRGLVLYHPGQDPVEPKPYPWAVKAAGDRCYAIDTVLVNAWLGIDFGSGERKDHYISYVSGAPIRCGILAGSREGGMWVENVQFNPHYWYRCDLPGRPDGETWKEFWHNQIRFLDAFAYGANENLHVLNTFVFAARNGVLLFEQEGRGARGCMIGHGTDGGECGIRIDCDVDVEFINTELVTIESPNRRIYLRNAGKGASFYNTLMWGAPDTAVLMEKGELKLILTNIVDLGETAVIVEDGKAEITATHFYRRKGQLQALGGQVRFLANMAPGPEEGEEEPLPAGEKKAEVFRAYNWHR